MNLTIIRDGDLCDPTIVISYNIEKLCRDGRYNFVGFINKKGKALLSLPKHFLYTGENDIKLIIKCLAKKLRKSDKGSNDLIDCNIPYKAYLDILLYYNQHGLFVERNTYNEAGYAGKIDWNRTFRKSKSIINDNNVVFLPFQIKKNKAFDTFIGECMIFALNEGYREFGKYLGIGSMIEADKLTHNFKNKKGVIKELKSIEAYYFKDSEIQLIRSLISYFKWQGSILENSYFLTQNFELLWEEMVEKYLNSYLLNYDFEKKKMILKKGSKKFNFKKVVEYAENPNKNNHDFKVEYDHLLQDYYVENKVMLFDSKYYTFIKELNYKQVAYHYFLMNGPNGRKINSEDIVNGLILPTEYNYYTNVHLDRLDIDGVYIQEHYINLKEVMKNYLEVS